MSQLIDKDKVLAEIERLDEFYHISESAGGQAVVESFLSFIDTLEVKESDLDTEIILWANVIPEIRLDDIERIAKYFFELGLKAQKGE